MNVPFLVVPILLALSGCADPPAVRVAAASSLREAVEGVAAEWERRGGGRVELRFDATSALARQIAEGAPADVFLTAAPEGLDGLATLERREWLGNRLVAVVPAEAGGVDLARARSLALAPEEVPAGRYALAALAHGRIPLPARVIYGSTARDVLEKVAEGGAEAGVVYATDAAVEPRVRVLLVFPADSHPPIVYTAGVLTEGGLPFAAALREEWALALCAARGFEVLP